jgi:hypothetical protein
LEKALSAEIYGVIKGESQSTALSKVESIAQRLTATVNEAVQNFTHDTNSPPEFIGATGTELAENAPGSLTINISDAELGQRQIVIPIDPADFERVNFIDVPWSFTDHGGLSVSGTQRVQIINVNEAPVLEISGYEFDGQTLTIQTTVKDPDGESLVGREFVYSAAELATDIPAFSISVVDGGGLESNRVIIDPPQLAAQAASESPVPPAVLGYSITELPENQIGVLTITAWDAIDGNITHSIQLSRQDYEANKSLSIPFDIQNSSGLHTTGVAEVRITNVNEAPTLTFDAATLAEPRVEQGGTLFVQLFGSDPDGDQLTYQVTQLSENLASSIIRNSDGTAVLQITGFDYSKAGGHGITVKATDEGGLGASKQFLVWINDPLS